MHELLLHGSSYCWLLLLQGAAAIAGWLLLLAAAAAAPAGSSRKILTGKYPGNICMKIPF
jgi:hypothetical protein